MHLTGFDALAEDSGGDSEGPGVLLEAVIGGLGALLVLTFVFASLLAFVPMVMAIVSIMTTFLLLLGLTELTDVSPIVQFLIALIGLGVAIDYSLIVVSRWREERAHGREGDEAVQRAMETAGRAVVFSGITVAIGLLALIALPLPFLRSMGYGGMLIPLVSTLVAITLLPVVLAKLGPRLDWPHRRTDDKASRAWTRWARGRLAPPLARGRRRHGGDPGARLRRHRPAARHLRRRHDGEVGRRQGRARSRSRTPASARARCCRTRSSSRADTDPEKVAADAAGGRRHPRRGRARTPPTGAAAGPRSSRRSRSPTAASDAGGATARRRARHGPRGRARTSASAASRRRTTTSSTPSTAASR